MGYYGYTYGGPPTGTRRHQSSYQEMGDQETLGDDLEEASPAPQSCEATSWGDWSDCSTACGTGTRTRTRRYVEQRSSSEASPKDEDDHKDYHDNNKPARDKHVAAKVAPKTNCKTSARRSETSGSSEEVASWRSGVRGCRLDRVESLQCDLQPGVQDQNQGVHHALRSQQDLRQHPTH